MERYLGVKAYREAMNAVEFFRVKQSAWNMSHDGNSHYLAGYGHKRLGNLVEAILCDFYTLADAEQIMATMYETGEDAEECIRRVCWDTMTNALYQVRQAAEDGQFDAWERAYPGWLNWADLMARTEADAYAEYDEVTADFEESDPATWTYLPSGYQVRDYNAATGEMHLYAPDGRDVTDAYETRRETEQYERRMAVMRNYL